MKYLETSQSASRVMETVWHFVRLYLGLLLLKLCGGFPIDLDAAGESYCKNCEVLSYIVSAKTRIIKNLEKILSHLMQFHICSLTVHQGNVFNYIGLLRYENTVIYLFSFFLLSWLSYIRMLFGCSFMNAKVMRPFLEFHEFFSTRNLYKIRYKEFF